MARGAEAGTEEGAEEADGTGVMDASDEAVAAGAASAAGRDGGAAEAGQALASLSYEQARGELVRVVQQLEAGGATLEESLALWERGEELARICREWLEGARARLDAVLEAEEEAEEGEEEGEYGDGAGPAGRESLGAVGEGLEEGVAQARQRGGK